MKQSKVIKMHSCSRRTGTGMTWNCHSGANGLLFLQLEGIPEVVLVNYCPFCGLKVLNIDTDFVADELSRYDINLNIQ